MKYFDRLRMAFQTSQSKLPSNSSKEPIQGRVALPRRPFASYSDKPKQLMSASRPDSESGGLGEITLSVEECPSESKLPSLIRRGGSRSETRWFLSVQTVCQLAAIILASCFYTSTVSADWIQPPAETDEGYRVPQPDVQPVIPAAHGAHREYAIEWWYWVGHLQTVQGAHELGFQSTVFRLAGESGKAAAISGDALAANQLYMSHAALSDLTAKQYTNTERIYREGWQAQSATGQLDLHVGAITAKELEGEDGFSMTVLYPDAMELRLKLYPVKPLTVFGERGLSRKGGDPAAVSWYWTYTRLRVEGEWVQGDSQQAVEGIAWMDHEISSSQLGSDLEGWDWTAMQLDDGTEVKAYRLRTAEGGSDPWSAVYWIDAEGQTRSVYAKNFTWEIEKSWKSPQSGVTYPTTVTIRATDPKDGSTKIYKLRPLLDEQEFTGNTGSNPYWEGACEVLDAANNPIGRAYLELAGYGGGLGSILQ